jgi:hypothetical protein
LGLIEEATWVETLGLMMVVDRVAPHPAVAAVQKGRGRLATFPNFRDVALNSAT